MNCFKKILAAAVVAASLSAPAAARPALIKFATLAPEGSSWMKSMKKFAAEAEKAEETAKE